jgi:IS30 family transposase
MANRLKVAKVLSIKTLHAQGWSQRRIARELGVSRGAVARQLQADAQQSPTSGVPDDSNRTKAPPGSEPAETSSNRAKAPPGSRSLCGPFREQILAKLDQGLSAQRIFQDLVAEHGFAGQYHSVRRFVAKLNQSTPNRLWRRCVGCQ